MTVDNKNYKWPIVICSLIIATLMLMLSIGFTIGFLTENPDGLERTLIDANGESWVENLPSPWDPILGWIQNDYIIGLIGTLLSVVLIMSVFYLVVLLQKRKRNS